MPSSTPWITDDRIMSTCAARWAFAVPELKLPARSAPKRARRSQSGPKEGRTRGWSHSIGDSAVKQASISSADAR
jgi:hypothetical protein